MTSPIEIGAALLAGSNWTKLPEAQVLLLAHDVDRTVRIKGRWYSAILDSFAESLAAAGLSCARVATPLSRKTGSKATGSPCHYNRAELAFRIRRRLRLNPGDERLTRILRRTRASIVIAIDPSAAWARACRSEGVTFVEMFHGIGYTTLPARPPAESPDYHICFDEVTAQALVDAGAKRSRILRMRHPWLHYFLTSTPEFILRSWPQLSPLPAGSPSSRRVVVTLQWGYDGEDTRMNGICPDGVFPPALLQAIKSTREDVTWILRLHPVQTCGRRYSRHRELVGALTRQIPRVVADYHDVPLPALLASGDAHVTLSSMACYEAAWLGLPSLALCPTVQPGGAFGDYFNDLEAEGFVTKGSRMTAAEVIAWIKETPRPAVPRGLWGQLPSETAEFLRDFSQRVGRHGRAGQTTG